MKQSFIKISLGCILLLTLGVNAQSKKVKLTNDSKNGKVEIVSDKNDPIIRVVIDGKHFTSFFFPDTIAKPVLYPILAPNGTVITRGFPVTPIPGEPTDHPHHLGLWFNFGDVNGLDFWNNSFAIPADKKHLYGNIRMGKITENKSGEQGRIGYEAIWNDNQNNTLLDEKTSFVFSEINGTWVIDRTTSLTARTKVEFKDNKEGMLGLRMAHELQIPTVETKKFTDANGIETVIKAVTDTIANGNYLNSNGLKGDDVWGKKATWCMMHAKMKQDTISVLILDHPKNEGYPTYWHARGYGLFAANPMGSNVFGKQNPVFQRTLQKGESVTFRFRVAVAAGKTILQQSVIESLQKSFAVNQ